MYTVSAEPSRKLVRIKLVGFLSHDEVAGFARAEQAAIQQMGCRSGEYLVLVDTTEFLLQTQDVATELQNLVNASAFRAKRIAIVNGESAFRMQARRLLTREEALIFDTLAEAEAWLFRPDEPAADRDAA